MLTGFLYIYNITTMPSDIIISIRIKGYLKEYAVHKWGPEPIVADRKNRLSGLIRPMLQMPPQDYKNSEGNLQIRLPFYKNLNVYSKNFLSDRSQAMIGQAINDDFLVDFYGYMNKAYLGSRVPGIRKRINLAIVNFIDEYELGSGKDVHEMLRKKYYRYRKEFYKKPKHQEEDPEENDE
jgi:hypothetical protein